MATICGLVLGVPSVGVAKSRLFGEETAYKPGLKHIVHEGITLGFSSREERGRGRRSRYWSPGYSVSITQLERIIKGKGALCLRALDEAHRLAANELRKNSL
jgi:deoxyinosine 3'endonuclease (endonuclease V)